MLANLRNLNNRESAEDDFHPGKPDGIYMLSSTTFPHTGKDASVLPADSIVSDILNIRILDSGNNIDFGVQNPPFPILFLIKPDMVVIVWFKIDGASVYRIGNRAGIFDNNMADSLVTPFPAALRILERVVLISMVVSMTS